jgi:ABC-2 type transport system ATP-binding protein
VTSAAIVVEDLHKVYPGGVEAVRGLWLDVRQGEIFGLLGPNGAGKSTTFGVLTTTVRPTRGRAVVAGHDVRRDPLSVRRSIGVVFQNAVVDNEFTARDNLRLHARLRAMSRRDAESRIDALLTVVGLASRADDTIRTYSGGMRRRLELARALLARPPVVLLDEPTAGLDPTIREAVWRLVGHVRRDHDVTVVVSTHHLEEAEQVCDRVAIVDRGRLVVQGRPRDLVEDLGGEILEMRVARNASAVARMLARTDLSSHLPRVRGETVTVPLTVQGHVASAALAEVGLAELGVDAMTIRRTTLADVYSHLTASPAEDNEAVPA